MQEGGTVFKRTRRSLPTLVLALAALLAGAVADASATTVYVSNTAPVVPGGKSCAKPRFSRIQEAIDAAGVTSVKVCSGTYTEQLTITQPISLAVSGASGSADVVLPAEPEDSKTPCDEAPGTESFQPDQDGVSICTSGTVSVKGIDFEPKFASSTCDESVFGILVAGGATLKATEVEVDGGGAFPINGCQGGIGIQVGMAWTTPVEVGHLTLKQVSVLDYQKNGITVDGAGSTATGGSSTITGAGPTAELAQNGLQVSNGAVAKLSSLTIAGNECDNASCGSDALAQTQATGILFDGAAPSTAINDTSLIENDAGAYYFSASEAQPSRPEVTLTKDVFTSNRYEGVVLDQGKAAVNTGIIRGTSNVGIDLLQYEGQTLSSQSTASRTSISENTEVPIKVQSDKAAGDIPGRFTFRDGFLKGSVVNESSTFEVVT